MLPDGRLVLASVNNAAAPCCPARWHAGAGWPLCAVLLCNTGLGCRTAPMPTPLCKHLLCRAVEYEDEDYYRTVTTAQLQDGKHIETEIYVWVESKR